MVRLYRTFAKYAITLYAARNSSRSVHEDITNPRNPPGGRVSGVSMTSERTFLLEFWVEGLFGCFLLVLLGTGENLNQTFSRILRAGKISARRAIFPREYSILENV
jgi:hypothetical protein